jgi:hypothetical protein
VAYWQTRELDHTTADAVALMTLYVGATEADDASADELFNELFASPDGVMETFAGFESLCGALLVLLELETGASPDAVLQRVGAMVAAPGRLLS